MDYETAARIVSRMTFSAAEYAIDSKQILARAIALYSAQTGDHSPEATAELALLLDRSFDERKRLSICNEDLPDHLRDGSRFQICVDDTVIIGRVSLSPKDISVEILFPFQGRTAGSELMLLAPVIWTELPEPGSEANEEGREKAVKLLADIYYSMLR